MTDMVEHPPHYQTEVGLEAIDVIKAFFRDNYNLGQVFKYIARTGKKWDDLEDLKKARWYLDKEIEWREQGTQPSLFQHPVLVKGFQVLADDYEAAMSRWEPKIETETDSYSPYVSRSPKIGDQVLIKAINYEGKRGVIVDTRRKAGMYPYQVEFDNRITWFSRDELWVKQ